MHLVPTTSAGKKALEDWNGLNSLPPKKSKLDAVNFYLTIFACLAYIINDSLPLGSAGDVTAGMIILLVVGILNVPDAHERRSWQRERNRKLIAQLRKSGDIMEPDEEITQRWESLRYKFALLDEPRAELNQFPGVVRQIVALHKARKVHPDRYTRKALDARIEQAMREALKPIEAELDALYDFTEMATDLEERAAKELKDTVRLMRIAYRDVETEMLLRTL